MIPDLNMPGLGGADTLPAVRALCPTVPVLIATGRADKVAQELVETTPDSDLLAKPFELDVLATALEHWLDPTRANRK